MYLIGIYKVKCKPIILSLFKFDTLNFTLYILTILTYPLKTYVIRLHNPISMKISFTMKMISKGYFPFLVTRHMKTNKLLK